MLQPIIYLVVCLLAILCCNQSGTGFFGTFILAIITAPLMVLPVLLLTGPSRRVNWCRGL